MMGKTLFLLTICLASIATQAQNIDKRLLIGKWDLYSMESPVISICRDSLAQNVNAIIRALNIQSPGLQMSVADSIALANGVKTQMAALNIVLTFDENGNTTQFLGMLKDFPGNLADRKGTYEWVGENKIIQKLQGKTDPEISTILSLTEKKMVMHPENDPTQKNMIVTFTKVK